MKTKSHITIRFSAESEERLHEGVVALAHSLDDPDRIVAIALGDGFADVDVDPAPVNAKRLH